MPSISASQGVLALVCAAGITANVHGQTFVFSNDCGTGSWGASCSLGGGQWQSNWGRTGPNPALLVPGAADACLISGTVNLDVNATVAGLTVPSGATLNWQPVTFNAGTMTNNGTVALNGVGNRFFSGAASVSAGAQWSVSSGGLYLQNTASINNQGVVTLSDGGALRRNGGAVGDHTLTNTGVLRAGAAEGRVVGLRLNGVPGGRWRSEAGAVLVLEDNSVSGMFTGDFLGSSRIDGLTLVGTTTLNTTAGSGPWDWASGTLNTGSSLCTNAGQMRISGTGNKFILGALSNGGVGTIELVEGAVYLNPQETVTTFSNVGQLRMGPGASLRRNGGLLMQSAFVNAGTLRAMGAGAAVIDLAVSSNNGQWVVDSGASLELVGGALGGTYNGSFAGPAYLDGSMQTQADTTLRTAPGTPNPWRWRSGTISSTLDWFTNAGWLESTTAANKFLAGTFVNGAGAVWDHSQGSLYFNPGTSGTRLFNEGLLRLGSGASVRRNGGSLPDALFTNISIVRATQPGGVVADLSVESTGGNWQSDAGASLELAGGRWSGSFIGQFAGDSLLTGAPTLFGDTSFSTTPTSVNPWRWTSANVTTGAFTLTNAGRMEMTTAANKFLSGLGTNSAGAVWTVAQGTFYFNPTPFPTAFTNHGTVSLLGGAAIARNSGAAANAAFVSDGEVVGAGPDTRLQGLALTSNNGTWRTTTGNALEFAGTNLAGRFVFDNAGSTFASGNMLLTGDTTFTTSPSSPNPFQWTAAFIDAGAWTFTNTGRLEMTTAANKFIAGAFVNAVGAEWTCAQGNLFFNPGSPTPTRLDNNGTLTLLAGTSLNRNAPAGADTTLNNNGLLYAAGIGSSIASLTVNNNSGGVIRIAGTLDLPSNWTMQNGRLDGTGVFTSAGNGFVNAGVVAPGPVGGTGVLSSAHRFNQASSGVLEIALVNDGANQTASKLALTGGGFTGQAALGGTLRVTLPTGTSPSPIGARSYVVVDAPGGLSGTFSSVVDANPVADVRYTVTYNSTQAVMHVIRRCGGADMGSVGADTNFDGALDNNDFVVFINLFFEHDARADVGQAGGVLGVDGQFDNNDFIAFITLFFSGCP